MGVAFTRWGRTACPNNPGTSLLYSGKMAGSKWDTAGSTNYLCLHNIPQFVSYSPGIQTQGDGRAHLYGTEYEARDEPPAFGSMRGHNAPCSVCYSSGRTSSIMIPGTITCPSSWTMEYNGYLMTEASHHPRSGRAPVCVDSSAQSISGSQAHEVLSQLFFIEVRCGGLCPPYDAGQEMSCVVCTK